ncbi:hypothetical protein LMG22931_02126 [Paraburkholderia nemoris]|jgi:hypothetical protein|nr:hypothetical protein LMG22931_02126 [Paraburkholderia nemoris]
MNGRHADERKQRNEQIAGAARGAGADSIGGMLR